MLSSFVFGTQQVEWQQRKMSEQVRRRGGVGTREGQKDSIRDHHYATWKGTQMDAEMQHIALLR